MTLSSIIQRSLLSVVQKTNILVGGQAVIEGVMMRVPGAYATAVRNPEGGITIDRKPFTSLTQKYKIFSWPVFRGVIALFESMKIGMETLTFSAEASGEEVIEETVWTKIVNFLMTVFSFALAIGLFFVLPLWLTTKVFDIAKTAWVFNIVSGLFRILFFLLYLFLISLMKDVKRLFRYHGAEHKTIYAFENGTDMSIDAIRPFTTYHPRCGTSFLFVSLLMAIILYAVIDSILILIFGPLTLGMRLLFHLPMIPLVMGVGYEGIKFTSRHMANPLVGWMTQPGLWLQRITTQPPDDSMLEVAVTALKEAFADRWDKYKGKTYTADAIE